MAKRALAYIQAVAEQGSIKNAAEQLLISSSALSKYIQKVEKELGTPLFNRFGNRFVLSYAGERYLAWAEQMDALEEMMLREMRELADHRQGKIRIGTQSFVSGLFTDRILPDFYQKYPRVCVSLSEDVFPDMVDKLKWFQVDAVAAGIGILFGADAMLNTNTRHYSKLKLVSFGEKPRYRETSLVYHKDLYLSAPLQHLFSLCRKYFAREPEKFCPGEQRSCPL